MRTETITSAQNPKIKEALSLGYKSNVRREKGLFLVEGRRELERCLGAGFSARTFFRCPEILSDSGFSTIEALAPEDARCFLVPRALYEKIAYRGGTEGVIAEVAWRTLTLADLQGLLRQRDGFSDLAPAGRKPALIVVLESVEKPGNLGAVLRSADAAGADAVIVCDPLTDLYNPNLIRASVGAIFTVPTVCCSSADAIKWLKDNNIQILTAQLQDSSLYYDVPMTGPTAIVMGTEATGLTPVWREAATAHIRIPMPGVEDSLNVSVSAAILLFEAVRQRMGKE